jgi:hypothetical protein
MTRLEINNPCGHTGAESSVCEICGYPDPRKMIAALKSSKLVFVPELSDDMKETYLEENIALQAKVKELEAALEEKP